MGSILSAVLMATPVVIAICLAGFAVASLVYRSAIDYPEPGCKHCAGPIDDRGYCRSCRKYGTGLD